MRLDLEKLRRSENVLGTVGREGTDARDEASRCSHIKIAIGTPGAPLPVMAAFVPAVPTGRHEPEQEVALVYEPVPDIPAILSRKGDCKNLMPVGFQEPSLWYDDFSQWALECCAFRDRSFGGILALHLHFCDWCATHKLVPCVQATFEALLLEEPFRVVGDLVCGLILKEDQPSSSPSRRLNADPK